MDFPSRKIGLPLDMNRLKLSVLIVALLWGLAAAGEKTHYYLLKCQSCGNEALLVTVRTARDGRLWESCPAERGEFRWHSARDWISRPK